MKKNLIIVFVIIVFIVAANFVATPLRIEKNEEFWTKEQLTAVISSPDIIPFMLGFESVLANYLWIKTMLYVGENIKGDNDGVWLREMIKAVNMLNPSFFPSYEFAALVMPNITGDWEGARLILENGIPLVDGSRKRFLYFYLGWIYYTQYRDYTRAAELFAFSGRDPRAPAHWRTLSATMLSDAGQIEQSMLFLLDLYAGTDDPQVKKILRGRIADLYKEHKNEFSFKIPSEFLERESN